MDSPPRCPNCNAPANKMRWKAVKNDDNKVALTCTACHWQEITDKLAPSEGVSNLDVEGQTKPLCFSDIWAWRPSPTWSPQADQVLNDERVKNLIRSTTVIIYDNYYSTNEWLNSALPKESRQRQEQLFNEVLTHFYMDYIAQPKSGNSKKNKGLYGLSFPSDPYDPSDDATGWLMGCLRGHKRDGETWRDYRTGHVSKCFEKIIKRQKKLAGVYNTQSKLGSNTVGATGKNKSTTHVSTVSITDPDGKLVTVTAPITVCEPVKSENILPINSPSKATKRRIDVENKQLVEQHFDQPNSPFEELSVGDDRRGQLKDLRFQTQRKLMIQDQRCDVVLMGQYDRPTALQALLYVLFDHPKRFVEQLVYAAIDDRSSQQRPTRDRKDIVRYLGGPRGWIQRHAKRTLDGIFEVSQPNPEAMRELAWLLKSDQYASPEEWKKMDSPTLKKAVGSIKRMLQRTREKVK